MEDMTNDSSNFRAFEKMRIESRDEILQNHLETCPRLVTYV